MFSFNMHILWGEGDAGKLLRGMVAMVVVFLFTYSRNQDYENICVANASLRASLIDLESLRSL